MRITKEQAIATAKEQIEFTPQQTQIRLLRQGLSSKPFWIVSLSVPRGPGEGDDEEQFAELALVRVDANTGKVASVSVQRNENQPPQP